MEPIIFISHSSKNAEIADILRDFLVGAGIPNNYIFCSSLPGNDVRYTIPAEVKAKLGRSTVSIAILSNEYYNTCTVLMRPVLYGLWTKYLPL